ncbi:MAG: DUF6884 domain-containing protein [bacterium]
MNRLRSFLQPPAPRLLIVSACTAKKKFSLPDQLTVVDLDNPASRKDGVSRLARYRLPAAEMYAGAGHGLIREAVKTLREHGYLVSHFILSAGYGLLSVADMIVPYNVTFSGASKKWIRERGQRLGLRSQLVAIADGHNRVILILGREYLEAIGLPLPTEELPHTLAYIAPSLIKCVGHGVEIVAVGEAERREIGAHSSSAKERRFQLDEAWS